jgi:hypothetical protein
MVETGQFESEDAAMGYVLDAMPWLVTTVHTAGLVHGDWRATVTESPATAWQGKEWAAKKEWKASAKAADCSAA